MMIKGSVNRALETTLAEGLRFERYLFHATFATEDQKQRELPPSARSASRDGRTAEARKRLDG
jgi:hypothetical protein